MREKINELLDEIKDEEALLIIYLMIGKTWQRWKPKAKEIKKDEKSPKK